MKSPKQDYPFIPFTNHLVFRRVMRDPHTAKEFLERILHLEIDRVEYCNTEQMMDFDLDTKGVRLDLYVKDGSHVFNVEMQTQDYNDIGRRMAYYQSAINSGVIERGAKRYKLPESFIIFLCTSDPFTYGRPLYTFEVSSKEVEGLILETGSHWLVFNAAAYEREKDQGIRSLLQYMVTEEVASDDPLVNTIDEKVRILNHDKELVAMASMYMTFEEDALSRGEMRGERKGEIKGRAEGIEVGEERYAELAASLVKAGRIEDIERAAEDKALRKQLLQEFDLA